MGFSRDLFFISVWVLAFPASLSLQVGVICGILCTSVCVSEREGETSVSNENSSLARVLDELAVPPEQEAISMSDELSAGACSIWSCCLDFSLK